MLQNLRLYTCKKTCDTVATKTEALPLTEINQNERLNVKDNIFHWLAASRKVTKDLNSHYYGAKRKENVVGRELSPRNKSKGERVCQGVSAATVQITRVKINKKATPVAKDRF